MPAQRLAKLSQPFGIHYAWVVVAAIFLTALTTAGAVGIPGALILPLGREFGWDNAEISGALGLRLALFGLMAPFAAALIETLRHPSCGVGRDRLDHRRARGGARHDPGLAAYPLLGDRRRRRHRDDGAGALRDRRQPLVSACIAASCSAS